MHRTHLALVVGVMIVGALAVGGLLAQPRAAAGGGADQGPDVTVRAAELVAVAPADGPVDTAGLAPDAEPLVVTARLDDGREVTFDMIDETGDTFRVGQAVRLTEAQGPEGTTTWYVSDIRRERPLIVLCGVFLAAVVLFGRWQGVRALVGLAITLGAVVVLVVPALLAGSDPLVVASCAAVAIMVVTLYLAHGITPKTTAAVLGTLVALAITVGLSALWIELASLTGLANEEARLASVSVGGLSLSGLLLAGIIIGTLGVLDDVTIAQSSTVFQLRAADPTASIPTVFSRAMTVGRDHVASTINTLFLAYAGASLPLLILFSGSPDPLGVIVSSELVATEIVRALVGSVGLMASVPLTTLLAAWLADVPVVRADDTDDTDAAARQPEDADAADGDMVTPDSDRDVGVVLRDATPFSPDDAADSEWERRLRESYGLDRRRPRP